MADKKINSWDELKKIRAEIRKAAEESSARITLAVGMGTCGIAAGAGEVYDTLEEELKNSGREDVKIVPVGCYGFCYAEPMVEVREAGKPNIQYGYVNAQTARDIINKHIANNEVLEDHVIRQEVRLG